MVSKVVINSRVVIVDPLWGKRSRRGGVERDRKRRRKKLEKRRKRDLVQLTHDD